MSEEQKVIYVEKKSNGMAVAGLVLGIIGVVFGLIPLFYVIAFICGILAFIFGFAAWRAYKKDNARGRKGMSIAAIILGAASIALGVVGALIVNDAFEDLENELNSLTVEESVRPPFVSPW